MSFEGYHCSVGETYSKVEVIQLFGEITYSNAAG